MPETPGFPEKPFALLTGEAAELLRTAHPGLEAMLTNDERLADLLPGTLAALLGRAN